MNHGLGPPGGHPGRKTPAADAGGALLLDRPEPPRLAVILK